MTRDGPTDSTSATNSTTNSPTTAKSSPSAKSPPAGRTTDKASRTGGPMQRTGDPRPSGPDSQRTSPETQRTLAGAKRQRPAGELGGHTVQPWEQPDTQPMPDENLRINPNPAGEPQNAGSKDVPAPSSPEEGPAASHDATAAQRVQSRPGQEPRNANPAGARPLSDRNDTSGNNAGRAAHKPTEAGQSGKPTEADPPRAASSATSPAPSEQGNSLGVEGRPAATKDSGASAVARPTAAAGGSARPASAPPARPASAPPVAPRDPVMRGEPPALSPWADGKGLVDEAPEASEGPVAGAGATSAAPSGGNAGQAMASAGRSSAPGTSAPGNPTESAAAPRGTAGANSGKGPEGASSASGAAVPPGQGAANPGLEVAPLVDALSKSLSAMLVRAIHDAVTQAVQEALTLQEARSRPGFAGRPKALAHAEAKGPHVPEPDGAVAPGVREKGAQAA